MPEVHYANDAAARLMSVRLNELTPISMGARRHLSPSESQAVWNSLQPVIMRLQERAWEKGYGAGWADSGDTATGSDAPETVNPYAPGDAR